MAKAFKWAGFTLLAMVALMAAAGFALHQWVRTDDFRARVEREASAALGVPVRLGRLSVDVWPLPAVAADQVHVQAQPPLTLERIEARPVWTGLLGGRLEISTLIVRQAVVPQAAVAAIAAGLQKRPQPAAAPSGAPEGGAPLWPRSVRLAGVTWVDDKGQRLTVDAQADLGTDGLVDDAKLQVTQGRFVGARAQLRREGPDWPLRVDIGGGSITGKLQIQPVAGKPGLHLLQGNLTTDNVEVAALTAPSKTLSGKLQAQTSLRGEFRALGQLADVLATQTRFTVRDALIQGIDLAKAVETVGLSRGGLTRLDTLAGQVATQGRAVQITNLVATSGKLAANGSIAIAPNRSLSGRINVDVPTTKGALAVPLAVSGTLDDPSVMLTRSAMLGAAIGTVLAPGVGTGAGAATGGRLGDQLKGLFGR